MTSDSRTQLNIYSWKTGDLTYCSRGESLSDFADYDNKQTRINLDRGLLNSKIGYYLSHYQYGQKFVWIDADMLLVLEYDMKMAEAFAPVLKDTLAYLHARP